MKNSPAKDYHDYVFKEGKFIGAFEEMYQKVDDPLVPSGLVVMRPRQG